MRKIKLTQGKYALVDDANFEWLNQWKWTATKRKNGIWYAMRNEWNHGKQCRVYMHRQILNLKKGDGKIVDHIDHNGLDNRHCNIRICTFSQNLRNSCGHCDGTSKFKGVSWYKPYNKWTVAIYINGRNKRLGYFDSEIKAARVYKKAAKKYFGEFAHGYKI